MKIGLIDVDGRHFPNLAHRRVLALRNMGILPFAQPYQDFDKGEPTEEQKAFARWVNRRPIFQSCA